VFCFSFFFTNVIIPSAASIPFKGNYLLHGSQFNITFKGKHAESSSANTKLADHPFASLQCIDLLASSDGKPSPLASAAPVPEASINLMIAFSLAAF
jgi:hypothetical protein